MVVSTPPRSTSKFSEKRAGLTAIGGTSKDTTDEELTSKKYWRSHGDDFVSGSNHTIDNQYLWTPPLAYQQSLIIETTEPVRTLADQAKQLAVVPCLLALLCK